MPPVSYRSFTNSKYHVIYQRQECLFTSPMLPNPAGKNLPLPNSQVSIIDFCNFLHFSILLSSAFLGRFYKFIKICRTFYCFFRTVPLERHIIATREDSH
jgi:hypothetical protein